MPTVDNVRTQMTQALTSVKDILIVSVIVRRIRWTLACFRPNCWETRKQITHNAFYLNLNH